MKIKARLLAVTLFLLSNIGVAQQRPPQFEMEIKTPKLNDNLYILEG